MFLPGSRLLEPSGVLWELLNWYSMKLVHPGWVNLVNILEPPTHLDHLQDEVSHGLLSPCRSSDRAPSKGGQLSLAAPRSLLPSSAPLRYREEVHGRVWDVGPGAEGSDAWAGEEWGPANDCSRSSSLFLTVLKLTAAVVLCSKAAEKLRNLPEDHYRSKQKEKQDEGK